MIMKELQTPERLTAGKALLERLPVQHKKYREIELDYKQRLSGFLGEKLLDYRF